MKEGRKSRDMNRKLPLAAYKAMEQIAEDITDDDVPTPCRAIEQTHLDPKMIIKIVPATGKREREKLTRKKTENAAE